VIVTADFADDNSIEKIESTLLSKYSAGTKINDYTIVSLTMIFSNEISGGYKEGDRIKVLSG
jgi:hypothetical protein